MNWFKWLRPPKITREDVEARKRDEATLSRLKVTRDHAADLQPRARRVHVENNLTHAIFGGGQ